MVQDQDMHHKSHSMRNTLERLELFHQQRQKI